MSTNEHSDTRRHQRVREYWQLVSQTAEYRYRVCWEGPRRAMAERGFSPSNTIQATCDHGDYVNATFVLPDGQFISCDFREDITRPHPGTNITHWKVFDKSPEEDEYSLGAEILRDDRMRDAFDRAVLAFFDFHWRQRDPTLPEVRA
jgi:hypothetical protein